MSEYSHLSAEKSRLVSGGKNLLAVDCKDHVFADRMTTYHMELFALAAGMILLLAVWFIVAPLLRSEEEVKPLHRPRPGTRNVRGPREEDIPEPRLDPPEDGAVRCRHCGSVTDDAYQYCEECLEPLGRQS